MATNQMAAGWFFSRKGRSGRQAGVAPSEAWNVCRFIRAERNKFARSRYRGGRGVRRDRLVTEAALKANAQAATAVKAHSKGWFRTQISRVVALMKGIWR